MNGIEIAGSYQKTWVIAPIEINSCKERRLSLNMSLKFFRFSHRPITVVGKLGVFMRWYLEVMRKYAVFSGRARRKEYWMFVLFNILISFVLGFATGLIGAILGKGPALLGTVNLIYSLALLVPSIAVGVRRMHDTGRSGWWLLFPVVNLVLLCFDSEPDENEYGPNPKLA